jgi:hypothetical protein
MVAEWVAERVERHERGIVLVRNKAAQKSTRTSLREAPNVPHGWENLIELATLSEIQAGKVSLGVDEILSPGPLVSRYSGLLALSPARRMTVLAHGSWEAERAARQIRTSVERLRMLSSGEYRSRAAHRLFGKATTRVVSDTPVAIEMDVAAPPRNRVPSAPDIWDPFDIRVVGSLAKDDVDLEGPAEIIDQEVRGSVSALRIEFTDGSGCFEPSHLVSKVKAGYITEVPAKSLDPGDRIVLVDGSARKDLFDVIVEKLESLPEFMGTTLLIHEWHERARRAGFRSGFTQIEILRRMGPDAGITTTASIGNWIRGAVHGPDDPRDILRFGEAVGDPVLVQAWQPIGKALVTMRAHRRKLGRMLARVLEGLNPDELEDAGYFDRRLGIHYSDLTEAVSAHIVIGVATSATAVAYQYANRLLASEEIRLAEQMATG